MSSPDVPHPYHPYHPLVGCQLKMTRAQEHVHALYDAIDKFTGRNPYGVIDEFQPEIGYYVCEFVQLMVDGRLLGYESVCVSVEKPEWLEQVAWPDAGETAR